nr:glycosyltransferase family 1 protein [uncultured Agathobacter sp.]
MKKVLQVIGKLKIGGAENVAMNLYRYIDRTKFEFHYLVYGDLVGEYEEEVIKMGGKVIHINYEPKNQKKFKSDFENVIKKNGPYDVIHAHMMFHNGIVLKMAKKNKIPIRISHSHSTNDGVEKKNLKDYFIRGIYDYMSLLRIKLNGNVFLACGLDAGHFLYGKEFFDKNGIVIRNGIDVNRFKFNVKKRNIIREKMNFNNKHIYCCIGHFDTVKNHQFLINVFSKIVEIDKSAFLVLLGDGVLRKDIEELCVEKKVNDNVLFLGNVNNIDEWLQAVDFLLMPSLYEGIPVTLIEAQAAGVKCFVSDRISKEVDYSNTINFIPLENQEQWIRIADENINYIRPNNMKLVAESGYDVRENIKMVQKIYEG